MFFLVDSVLIVVVILAEDKTIQDKLAYYDLKVQTFEEVQPIQIYPARVLSHIFAHLGREIFCYPITCSFYKINTFHMHISDMYLFIGRNSKLGLSGRPSDVVGILATSKLYTLGGKTMAFLPQASKY